MRNEGLYVCCGVMCSYLYVLSSTMKLCVRMYLLWVGGLGGRIHVGTYVLFMYICICIS